MFNDFDIPYHATYLCYMNTLESLVGARIFSGIGGNDVIRPVPGALWAPVTFSRILALFVDTRGPLGYDSRFALGLELRHVPPPPT